MFQKKDFINLATVRHEDCVSIYIPTHRAGQETWNGKDAIKLKNKITQLKFALLEKDYNTPTINEFVAPLEKLQKDQEFWQHQSDGLAIFRTPEQLSYYHIPIRFKERFFLNNRFYLKPLIPLIKGQNRFFVLTLSQNDIQFFECTQHSIVNVNIDDLVPNSIEEVIGTETYPNELQFRTLGGGRAMYHGQGGTNSRKETDMKRFFRLINDGLMQMLHDENVPLILAGVDYLMPMFREVCAYRYLMMDRHISGNMENQDMAWIHEQAWELMEGFFNQKKEAALEHYVDMVGSTKATDSLDTIVRAAYSGRIEALYLREGVDYWGYFDKENQTVEIHNHKKKGDGCLLNMAAIQSTLHGSKVYLLDKEEMPIQQEACAVLRY